MLTSSNTPVSYATPIIIDTVSLNGILGILMSLTISKISLAFFLALFATSLLLSFSFSYIRISIFLENFSKVKFVSSVASVNW